MAQMKVKSNSKLPPALQKEYFGMPAPKVFVLAATAVVILILITGFLLPWGSIDGAGNMGGVDAEAEVDFYPYKLEYVAKADTSGVTGGSGYQMITGLAGSNDLISDQVDNLDERVSGNITREGEFKYYNPNQAGMQGDAGILYDSYSLKEYNYILVPMVAEDGYVYVWVRTETDMVPWWVAGTAQEVTVTLEINKDKTETEFQQVIVEEMWLEIWVGFDDEKQEFTSRGFEPLYFEEAKGKHLAKTGVDSNGNSTYSSISYSKKITLDGDKFDDYERVGIVGRVKLSLLDKDGQEEALTAEPATKKTPPSTVNVMVMPTEDAVSVAGFIFVFPLAIIAFVLVIAATILSVKKRRLSFIFFIISGILVLIIPVLFVSGIGTISDLILFENEIAYGTGLFVFPVAGFLLIGIGAFIRWELGPVEYKRKTDDTAVVVAVIDDEEVPKKKGGKKGGKGKTGNGGKKGGKSKKGSKKQFKKV